VPTPLPPVSFSRVLKQELEEIWHRRVLAFFGCAPPLPEAGSANEQAHRMRLLGVAFSGGGIRSATFNLGILQGLAKWGLLPYIDYLSTVSGGGYIGTWLHGVIKNKHHGDPRAAKASLLRETPGTAKEDPVTFLRKYSNYLAPRWNLLSTDAWVIGCIWLRNMLLNQMILVPFLASLVALTLFVGDRIRQAPEEWSWDLRLRVLWSLGYACLAVAVVNAVNSLWEVTAAEYQTTRLRPKLRLKGRVWPTVLGVLLFSWHLFWRQELPAGPQVLHSFFSGVAWAQSVLRTLPHMSWLQIPDRAVWCGVVLTLLFFIHQVAGGFCLCYQKRHGNPRGAAIHCVWMPIVSAAATTGLLWWVMSLLQNSVSWIQETRFFAYSWDAVIWGPPLLVVVVCAGSSLHVGLMGADFPDGAREWLARIAAQLALASAAWTAVTTLSIYGPWAAATFGYRHGPSAAAIVLAWGGSILAGLIAAGSSRTDGSRSGGSRSSGIGCLLLKLVPAILMGGILLVIAGACHWTIAELQHLPSGSASPVNDTAEKTTVSVTVVTPPSQSQHVSVDTGQSYDGWFDWMGSFAARDAIVLEIYGLSRHVLWILIPCAGLTLLLPLRFNINEFSMHHFYKNRLVRCYLGAGNAKHRKPNPFTGFDPNDDFSIAQLRPSHKAAHPYRGPYPIVNTTLNINAGAELATQERKANSFVFTPWYCGFRPLFDGEAKGRYLEDGYVRTEGFYGAAGPRIGTAMAVSGAAANPNWGYHTSAPVAFLLTMFNVRLGWWVGNPRVAKLGPLEHRLPSERPGPRYGLSWLLWELAGQTTDHSAYVNLSDGGHFENLGLYELVRRRCRYIVIGDGEQDPEYNFESLGGAIRKCRADFGVEIDIDISQIRATEAGKRTHCVVGSIKYPEKMETGHEVIARAKPDAEPTQALDDNNRRGWILYLKASLTGDEPEDVTQYHASHPAFPQESTMNQFFTESQFESYRRLGLHVVESALADIDQKAANLEESFQRLAALWYGEPLLAPGVEVKNNDAYSALLRRLSEDPALSFLDHRIMLRTQSRAASEPPAQASTVPATAQANAPPLPPPPLDWAVNRRAFFFIVDMIQLMENVWSDLGFDRQANRNHPKFQGWIHVFQHWAKDDEFDKVWQQVKKDYNPLFQDFVNQMGAAQPHR
jgi:hypothetical protein